MMVGSFYHVDEGDSLGSGGATRQKVSGNRDNLGELAHTPCAFYLPLDVREKQAPFLLAHWTSGPFCFGGRACAQTLTDDKCKVLRK